MPLRMPKLPPTSPVTTRTWLCGTRSTVSARTCGARGAPGCRCGACSGRVRRSYSPTAARGSSGAAATRVTTKSSRVTCAACARARATASRSPASHTKATLSGASSHTAGAPGRSGLRRRGDGGQRLVVDGHQSGGVGGLLRGLRDHERHGIADVADALAHQGRPRGGEGGRSVAPLARAVDRHVARGRRPRASAPVSTATTPGARARPRCRCRRCGHGRAASARSPRAPAAAGSRRPSSGRGPGRRRGSSRRRTDWPTANFSTVTGALTPGRAGP